MLTVQGIQNTSAYIDSDRRVYVNLDVVSFLTDVVDCRLKLQVFRMTQSLKEKYESAGR